MNKSNLVLMHTQRGYSLVEWMIAIFLGLFLTAALMSIFVSSKRATSEVVMSNERQENGHFALQLLSRDLKQAYFFAQATGEHSALWELNGLSITADNDCLDNIQSGSFPNAGKFRALWAATVNTATTSAMDCINDGDNNTSLINQSDYLSLKRVKGLAETEGYIDSKYYLDIDSSSLSVYLGDASALTTNLVSPVWRYIHHVYYLDSEDNIPRLRRLTLSKNAMIREEVLAEGIEQMKFMFALDHLLASERDGAMHSLVGTEQVTDNDWNTGRVIGIKVFLLVRSLEKTPNYVNSNTYNLGNYQYSAPSDNYKREVISTILTFENGLVIVDD